MLGLPGDYAAEPCQDCYATKVGGRPAPPPGAPPGALARRCGLCGGPTRLVLQAHAPLRGDVARPDRFLYVLSCAAPESPCALDPRGWVALRWLAPSTPDAGAGPPTEVSAQAQGGGSGGGLGDAVYPIIGVGAALYGAYILREETSTWGKGGRGDAPPPPPPSDGTEGGEEAALEAEGPQE